MLQLQCTVDPPEYEKEVFFKASVLQQVVHESDLILILIISHDPEFYRDVGFHCQQQLSSADIKEGLLPWGCISAGQLNRIEPVSS